LTIEDSFKAMQEAHKPIWDQETKTCRLRSNVHFDIMYGQMGFEQNLQNYVIKMTQSASETEWRFNRI
jgi:hypothetical protein